jgi:hypothetical protein
MRAGVSPARIAHGRESLKTKPEFRRWRAELLNNLGTARGRFADEGEKQARGLSRISQPPESVQRTYAHSPRDSQEFDQLGGRSKSCRTRRQHAPILQTSCIFGHHQSSKIAKVKRCFRLARGSSKTFA